MWGQQRPPETERILGEDSDQDGPPGAVSSQARLSSGDSDDDEPWDALRRCDRDGTVLVNIKQRGRGALNYVLLLKVTSGRTPGARTCFLDDADEAGERSVICL